MNNINTGFTTPKLSLTGKGNQPPQLPSGRADVFTKSPPPLQLMPKPQPAPPQKPADEVPHTQSSGKNNKLVLGAVLAAVAVAGIGGGMVAAHPMEQAQPVHMSEVQAERAQADFDYLQQFGTFNVQSESVVDRILGNQTPVDAGGAWQTMAEGRTVNFTPEGSSETYSLRGPESVRNFTRQVRDARVKAGFKAIGDSFKELGQNIGDEFRQIFR